MKGLAVIMGLKPKAGSKGPPLGDKPEPEAAEEESGGSEMEYARLASEATADGDHEAAAKALVSMVKACLGSYGPKE